MNCRTYFAFLLCSLSFSCGHVSNHIAVDQRASDEIDCETLGQWQNVTLERVRAEHSAVPKVSEFAKQFLRLALHRHGIFIHLYSMDVLSFRSTICHPGICAVRNPISTVKVQFLDVKIKRHNNVVFFQTHDWNHSKRDQWFHCICFPCWDFFLDLSLLKIRNKRLGT